MSQMLISTAPQGRVGFFLFLTVLWSTSSLGSILPQDPCLFLWSVEGSGHSKHSLLGSAPFTCYAKDVCSRHDPLARQHQLFRELRYRELSLRRDLALPHFSFERTIRRARAF